MLLSDFGAFGPISIPTPPIAALTGFFHVDTETNVHLLPVSWYLIFSLWMYLCSYMHIMSMLWSITAVRSGSWPILFKVLTLNVTICIALLHFSNFCFSLSCVTDFSNTEARAPTSAGPGPFLTARRAMRLGQVVWVWVRVIFRKLCFYSHKSHPSRWVAVVPRSNSLILAVVPWDSYAQNLVSHCIDPSLGLSTFTSTMLLPMALEREKKVSRRLIFVQQRWEVFTQR